MRSTRSRATFVLLALVLLSSAGIPAQASAPTGACTARNSTDATYVFANDWTGSRAGLVDEAARAYQNWVNYTSYWQGGPAIHWQGAQFTLRWASMSAMARACYGGSHNIEFNTQNEALYAAHAAAFEGIATHEWGHVWGIWHSGKSDSFDGDNPPTMETCNFNGSNWSTYEAQRSPSQDDATAIQYLTNHSSAWGIEFAALTANPSFERSSWKFWGSSGLSQHSLATSGGGVDGSPQYAIIRGTSDSSYMYQTTRYVIDPYQWPVGNTSGQSLSISARVNYKKYSSSDYGLVKLRYAYRTVTYSSHSGASSCQWPRDIDMNSSVSSGSWVWGPLKSCMPGTSWGYCTADKTTIVYSTQDGFDFRAYVYPQMWNSGSRAPVRIDRTRVLVTFDPVSYQS